jgi:cytosine/adenosine deaminase-related metal-dependent hydrolase
VICLCCRSNRGHHTAAIRSHTNIDPQSELRGIEAMIAVRERSADRMRIQFVAHVTSNATSMFAESKEWLRGAVSLGVDVIGGVPAFGTVAGNDTAAPL